MEFIIVLAIALAIAGWVNYRRTENTKIDFVAASSVAHLSKEEAEVALGTASENYLQAAIYNQLHPFAWQAPSGNDMRLWLFKAAAAHDRLNQLRKKPYGPEMREAIRKELKAMLEEKATTLAKVQEMETLRRRMERDV